MCDNICFGGILLPEKLWTRDFVLLSLSSFFMYLVFYCIMVVVVIYALQQFQATPAEAGMAAGDFLLAALLARLWAGHSIERVGIRRMMLGGLLLYGLVQGLYGIASNVELFMFVRFLHGLTFGLCATAVPTLAAHLVPKARQSEGMGYFFLSTTLASAAGPFIGMYIYQNHGFSLLLGGSCLMAVLALGLAACIRVPAASLAAVAAEPSPAKGIQGYFELKVLPISLISFVIYFCYSSLLSFFSAYAAEARMMEAGQYFFLLYSLAILLSRPQVGKLADRKGISYVMYPSFLSFALGLLLLSVMHTAALMFIAAALCGFGFGTFAAMGQVIAIQKVPKARFGIALSTILSISEMGTGIGPFFIGSVVSLLGFPGLYFSVAILVVGCGLAYAFCCQRGYI